MKVTACRMAVSSCDCAVGPGKHMQAVRGTALMGVHPHSHMVMSDTLLRRYFVQFLL